MPYWKHPPKPIVALISIDEARYTVLIYETLKGFEDGYRAEVPVLPGCSAEAKTQKEVLDRIAEAIRTHREADCLQASAPPDPPPGWKGPIFAWAMVLYLLEEMNEQEEQYKEIEALRTTHPEEAAARSSSRVLKNPIFRLIACGNYLIYRDSNFWIMGFSTAC